MLSFFNKIIDTLNELEIGYMLSGSIAMGLYVVPRATRDFDFIIHLQPNNINTFVEKFKDGFYCDIDSVTDAVKRKSMFNIIDFESGYKADFVILKNEEFRLTEFKRKQKMNFLEKDIYVVSIEDLIISKFIWIQEYQSQIQIEDLKALLRLENLDKNYLKLWILKLRIKTYNLFND